MWTECSDMSHGGFSNNSMRCGHVHLPPLCVFLLSSQDTGSHVVGPLWGAQFTEHSVT